MVILIFGSYVHAYDNRLMCSYDKQLRLLVCILYFSPFSFFFYLFFIYMCIFFICLFCCVFKEYEHHVLISMCTSWFIHLQLTDAADYTKDIYI